MARDKKSAPKTVKLDTVAPPPIVTVQKAEVKTATIAGPATKVTSSGVVKKAELIDRAVEKSGLKKRDVKPSVEAALDVLAEALIKGEELNLPPLGKLRVVKAKDLNEGARVLTLKLRTMKDNAGKNDDSEDDDSDTKATIKLKPGA